MNLGWSLFKIVSVSAVLYPRWPPCHFSKVWLRLAQQFQRRRIFLNFFPLFSNLHNRSKWVMGFTSKLQGR
jgi:hypothetical protein